MLKYLLLIVFLHVIGNIQAKTKLKEGSWIGNLHLNSNKDLPFILKVEKNKQNYSFTLHNGKEVIGFQPYSIINDSINIEFIDFNNSLRFIIDSKKSLQGVWINHDRKRDARIPFTCIYSKDSRFEQLSATPPSFNPTGNWKVTFNYDSDDAYQAVGVFNQLNETGYVEGTFLTETGDYRFLEGQVGANELNLSCFDGSHAFLFESHLKNDTLYGEFFAGKSWKTKWYAVKDEVFTLTNPDSLTVITAPHTPFTFEMKDIDSKTYRFPNASVKDKVVIIQIMGTWCPNCLDETRFYKMLHEKYNKDGLEIISIGYEQPSTFIEQASRLSRLKKMYALDFTFLVGGKANKTLASKHFSMLNEIISFPTSIYINKNGEIVRIHTGFSGPGTGDKYKKYAEETEEFIQTLLLN